MKKVFEGSEPEAKMMQEILTNAGIISELKISPRGLANIKSRFGGATFPNETWELLVRDPDEKKAKELLP